MSHLYTAKNGESLGDLDYTAADMELLLKAAKQAGALSIVLPAEGQTAPLLDCRGISGPYLLGLRTSPPLSIIVINRPPPP